jgi:fucose permease
MTSLALNFVRDRFTWLAYFMLAYYAYLQAALGPLMPFLGDELELNYTTRALHLSALALGMILAGLTAAAAARRFGRRLVFWGGGAGMALGAVLLVAARLPALTIAGTFVMGSVGTYLLIMIQATLSDHHQERRAIALTESNVAASVCSTLAPILVSQTEAVGVGWRAALLIGVGAWIMMALLFSQQTIPAAIMPTRGVNSGAERLSRTFWLSWLTVILVVAIEWCIIFWGADFLNAVVGMSRVSASGAMSIYFVAVLIGRMAGSRLTRSVPVERLLLVAIAIVLVAFPIFWLGQNQAVNLVGLFLLGIGSANLFPLTLSAASSAAAAQSNRASALVSLAAGLAILVMPQLLGSAADQIGIFGAFALTGLLALAALIVTVQATRLAARQG